MLFAGTDDGVYRLTGARSEGDATVQKVLDSGPVMRLRTVEAVDGVLAATARGLYHSPDGEAWTDLGVPRETVYSVAAGPDGRLYAGSRPAHVYVAEVSDPDVAEVPDSLPSGEADWTELEGFQELPSREEWRLPRHDDLAQVRDLYAPDEAPGRVVAGVEVGGVHVSDDGGKSWTERRGGAPADDQRSPASGGVDDDVHELLVRGAEEFVAGTGFGLFRSADAGQSWSRLDDDYEQRYFRAVATVDGDVYAGAALAHTATWDEPDADPALFVSRDGEALERVEHPRDGETVTGITGVDGDLAIATYRGSVLLRDGGDTEGDGGGPGGDGWSVVGSLSAPGEPAGSYTPLCWLAE